MPMQHVPQAKRTEVGFKAGGLRRVEEPIRHEVAHRQAVVVLRRPRAQRVQGPDFHVGADLPLRPGELEHHLLHPAGIRAGVQS